MYGYPAGLIGRTAPVAAGILPAVEPGVPPGGPVRTQAGRAGHAAPAPPAQKRAERMW